MQDEKQEILRIIPANLKQLRACMACSMVKVSSLDLQYVVYQPSHSMYS